MDSLELRLKTQLQTIFQNAQIGNSAQNTLFEYINCFEGKPFQHTHSLRVPLYASRISTHYALPAPWNKSFIIAAASHDVGKREMMEIVDKFPFTPADFIKMKSHPLRGAHIVEKLDPTAAAIVESHHFWKRPENHPYPQSLIHPQSPQTYLLSKMLAVIDCYDAVRSRPCRVQNQVANASLHTLSPHDAHREVQEEYAHLTLKRENEPFPSVPRTALIFMTQMYAAGIFNYLPDPEVMLCAQLPSAFPSSPTAWSQPQTPQVQPKV